MLSTSEFVMILVILTLVGVIVMAYTGLLSIGAMMNGIIALGVLTALFLITCFIDD